MANKEDIKLINTRYIKNDHVILPPITKLRCATVRNAERNAYNNVVFLKHLEATHTKTFDHSVDCPNHTCIIKATMRTNRNPSSKALNPTMYKRILDECGDSDILNDKKNCRCCFKIFPQSPINDE